MFKYGISGLLYPFELIGIQTLVPGKKAAPSASLQEIVYTVITTATTFQYKNKIFKLTIHTQQLMLQVFCIHRTILWLYLLITQLVQES